ncbi:MAG: helix-turn-helix transcriptional regulator [Leeuwenhoekiella sp.]
MEFIFSIDVAALRNKLKKSREEFANAIGYRAGAVGKWERDDGKIAESAAMLINFVFWKELGIDRSEILKHLRLIDPEPDFAEGAAHNPTTSLEKSLTSRLDQCEKRSQIDQRTIELLQQQIEHLKK